MTATGVAYGTLPVLCMYTLATPPFLVAVLSTVALPFLFNHSCLLFAKASITADRDEGNKRNSERPPDRALKPVHDKVYHPPFLKMEKMT